MIRSKMKLPPGGRCFSVLLRKTGSYDKIEDHMMLCVGAVSTNAELNYVKVVDGQSSSIVMKCWNADINDFICKVTVAQKTILP